MKPRTSSAVDSVKLYFFNSLDARSAGCPYTTIALLTGEDPWILRHKYKSNPTMEAKVMIKHLKSVGFKTTEITGNLSMKYLKDGKGFTNSHVILATVRMTAREASWVVFYGGLMWHNFEAVSTSYVTSLTFPLINAFILFLPEWDYCEISAVKKARIIEEAKLYRDISHRYDGITQRSIQTPTHEKPVTNTWGSSDTAGGDSPSDNAESKNTTKRT